MEYKGVNFIYPEWGMWEQFIYLDKSRYNLNAWWA